MSTTKFTDADLQNSDTVEQEIIPTATAAANKTLIRSCGHKYFAQIVPALNKIVNYKNGLSPNAVEQHPETFKRPYHILLEEKVEIEDTNAQIHAQVKEQNTEANYNRMSSFLRSARKTTTNLFKQMTGTNAKTREPAVPSAPLSDITEESETSPSPSRYTQRRTPK